MARPRELRPEDQARLQRYLHSGYNQVERRPFRPLLLLALLLLAASGLLGLSLGITRLAGIS